MQTLKQGQSGLKNPRDTRHDFEFGMDPNFLLRWGQAIAHRISTVATRVGWGLAALLLVACIYEFHEGWVGTETTAALPSVPGWVFQIDAWLLIDGYLLRWCVVRPLKGLLDFCDGLQNSGVQSRPYQAIDPAPRAACAASRASGGAKELPAAAQDGV